MNQERIIELYATVWLEVTKGVHPDDWYNTEIEHKIAVKFAELIVRECYEHCKGQVLDKEVADTNELTYNDAVSDCANGLLQHFGVEE